MSSKQIIPNDTKKVFQGIIYSVWQWEQEVFDGSIRTYEGIERADSVYTIGILPDKKILIILDEQPHREALLTPAGGQIDEGETPKQAAKREFLEETGYSIGRLTPWHHYSPNSRSRYTVHAFIGHNLEKIHEPQDSPGERIQLKIYGFNEFLELGKDEKIRDWKLRTILLEALIDQDKKKEIENLFYE